MMFSTVQACITVASGCYLVDHCAYGGILVHDDLAYQRLVRQLLGAQVEVRDVANRLERRWHLNTFRQQLLQITAEDGEAAT
jgi:hypothetical protein